MFFQDKKELAKSYLERQIGEAQKQILNISASDIGKNNQALVDKFIKLFKIKPAELGKAVIELDRNRPTRATVTWPITGNTSIIGLADSEGKSINTIVNSQTRIYQVLDYQLSISENEQLQIEIKQRVASITADLNSHITKLNRAVVEVNEELQEAIPRFVQERVVYLNRIKNAEDFLNS